MSDIENTSGVEAAIEAGEALAGVDDRVMLVEHPDDPSVKVYLATGGKGGDVAVRVMDDALAVMDARRAGPRRREGVMRFTEVDSLIAYVNRFKLDSSIGYADTAALAVLVVLDEHPAGADMERTAWRKHRASYGCPKSPEWIAWSGVDGAVLSQEKLADFIEGRLEDIATAEGYPIATEMLTMARNLTIRTKGTFAREVNPTTGDSVLINKTETDAGSTVIPRAFLLGIPVFEGGDAYRVEARIRFQLTDGRAAFSITLHRRKEIERAAFLEIRDRVAAATGLPVLAATGI
jgi:uncharacterized protein YfdQ (DUF2303 family)